MALVAEGRLGGVMWGALKTTLRARPPICREQGARPWRCLTGRGSSDLEPLLHCALDKYLLSTRSVPGPADRGDACPPGGMGRGANVTTTRRGPQAGQGSWPELTWPL